MMTFTDLKKRVPDAIKSEWRQHKNGDGWVNTNATVKPKVFVGVDAIIFGGTFRGGTFYGGTFRGGAWKNSPIQIQGSEWFVNQSRPGFIQIGCAEHSFEDWQKNGALIAEEHEATHKEEEYKRYIDLIVETGVPGE